MNARATLGRRSLLTTGCCVLWLLHCGCASYFRTRELSPDELNERNQERQQMEKDRLYEPAQDFSNPSDY